MKQIVCKWLAPLMCMKTASTTADDDDRDAAAAMTLDEKLDPPRSVVDVPNDTAHLPDQSASSSSSSAAAAERGIGALERQLASINDLLERKLRTDARLRQLTGRNQQLMSEWMIAAAVIDRFCFVVFSVSLIAGSFVFYVLFLYRP